MLRGLTRPEHLCLGQVLSGVRSQLLHEQVSLLNAHPQTGPRAIQALRHAGFQEHPAVAETYDYFPKRSTGRRWWCRRNRAALRAGCAWGGKAAKWPAAPRVINTARAWAMPR